jgi:hypothetical protein
MKKSNPGVQIGPDSAISAERSGKPKKLVSKIFKMTPVTSGVIGSDVVSDVVKIFWKEFYSLVKFCFRLAGKNPKKPVPDQ